jgi:hypothetical protein
LPPVVNASVQAFAPNIMSGTNQSVTAQGGDVSVAGLDAGTLAGQGIAVSTAFADVAVQAPAPRISIGTGALVASSTATGYPAFGGTSPVFVVGVAGAVAQGLNPSASIGATAQVPNVSVAANQATGFTYEVHVPPVVNAAVTAYPAATISSSALVAGVAGVGVQALVPSVSGAAGSMAQVSNVVVMATTALPVFGVVTPTVNVVAQAFTPSVTMDVAILNQVANVAVTSYKAVGSILITAPVVNVVGRGFTATTAAGHDIAVTTSAVNVSVQGFAPSFASGVVVSVDNVGVTAFAPMIRVTMTAFTAGATVSAFNVTVRIPVLAASANAAVQGFDLLLQRVTSRPFTGLIVVVGYPGATGAVRRGHPQLASVEVAAYWAPVTTEIVVVKVELAVISVSAIEPLALAFAFIGESEVPPLPLPVLVDS